jgi:hypothetical protein
MSENILFSGRVANTETKYVEVPVRAGALGAHIAWLDAVSSATITLEFTAFLDVAVSTGGAAYVWKDSGVSITGPAASAAGSASVSIDNVRQPRARLKIVGAAACQFIILDGTAP